MRFWEGSGLLRRWNLCFICLLLSLNLFFFIFYFVQLGGFQYRTIPLTVSLFYPFFCSKYYYIYTSILIFSQFLQNFFFLKPYFPDLSVPLPYFFLFFETNYYIGYCIKNWYYSQWVFQLLVSNRFFSFASTFTIFFYIFFISTSRRLRKKEEDICVGT